MKFILFIFLIAIFGQANGQQTSDQNQNAKTKEELQKLWNATQDAAVKKDRKSLENLYADEFLFIHATSQQRICSPPPSVTLD